MVDITNLIQAIVLPLVEHPDEVTIETVETDDFLEYHVHLNPSDIGRVIGKKGRVARSIRTILYSVRTGNQKRTRLVIADEGNND